MFGCAKGRLFTFKCEINHDRKALMITLLFVVSISFLAFILRVFELPYEQNAKIDNLQLRDFGSAIWLSCITMTTVGYGDIYPHTVGG